MSLKHFSKLIQFLSDESNAQVQARHLTNYFQECPAGEEKDHALQLLLNACPPKLVQAKQLASWTAKVTGYPSWLIERSVHEVGNPIKALSLLLHQTNHADACTLTDFLNRMSELRTLGLSHLQTFLTTELGSFSAEERLLVLKLCTGTFRSPVSEPTMITTLSILLKIDARALTLRLYHLRRPIQLTFVNLKQPTHDERSFLPNKFAQSMTLDAQLDSLGAPSSWMAFGKKQGIRVQLIKHGDTTHIWNEHGEIITDKFPEILDKWSTFNNDIHLSGQIIPSDPADDIELLINRMKKKTTGAADVRRCPAEMEVWQWYQKQDSAGIMQAGPRIKYAKEISFSSWRQLDQAHSNCRNCGYTSIVLVNAGATDQHYLWKAPAHSIRAVLMYVEFGSISSTGIRSLTFGLERTSEFVPVVKVDKLPDEHVLQDIIDFLKENTLERFGPVRTVKPALLYEVLFDEISASSRHKSGFKLKDARLGQRLDASTEKASSFNELASLL